MNLEYAAAAPTAESKLLSQAEISQDLKNLSRKRVTSLKGKKVPRTQPAVTDPAQSGEFIFCHNILPIVNFWRRLSLASQLVLIEYRDW